VGTPVWSSPVHGLEGEVDGRPWGAQQPAWRRLVAPSPLSVGDGDAMPRMVLGMVRMVAQNRW
jgi:hypothetical protein